MGKIFDYDGVPVLHTTSGDLKGYFYDGVYIYKGIPYAYADRFQMPVPSKWDGRMQFFLDFVAYYVTCLL